MELGIHRGLQLCSLAPHLAPCIWKDLDALDTLRVVL